MMAAGMPSRKRDVFGGQFHQCLTARCDELFPLVDTVLGAVDGGLRHGRIAAWLRTLPAGLSLPRFDGGRLVLAVDVLSTWHRRQHVGLGCGHRHAG
jgi:hypothetical protein